MSIIRALLILTLSTATAYGGTVTGTLVGPSGLPIKNGTLNFALQQAGLIVGTGSVVPTTAQCFTSTDGSVVGIPVTGAALNSQKATQFISTELVYRFNWFGR